MGARAITSRAVMAITEHLSRLGSLQMVALPRRLCPNLRTFWTFHGQDGQGAALIVAFRVVPSPQRLLRRLRDCLHEVSPVFGLEEWVSPVSAQGSGCRRGPHRGLLQPSAAALDPRVPHTRRSAHRTPVSSDRCLITNGRYCPRFLTQPRRAWIVRRTGCSPLHDGRRGRNTELGWCSFPRSKEAR